MSYKENENNVVNLEGIVKKPLEIINGEGEEKLYITTLSVKRLSGKRDFIPVVFSDSLTKNYDISINNKISIRGQYRSYNKIVNGRNHLKLYVYVNMICDDNGTKKDVNIITLDGFICKKPHYRITPLGKEITDIILAVDRPCGKNDYIPCICWWTNAKQAAELEVGDRLRVKGRIQSREYIKKSNGQEEKRTAYEVSASVIIPG